MSRHEEREAESFYTIRVIDLETGQAIETTWAKSRRHCDQRVSALRERYDSPDAYRIEVEE